MGKLLNLDNLSGVISDLKSKGNKIVHCHGVFDLIHIGHIKHFQEAKSFGDILIVSITPDKFVNKGPGRPAFTTSLRLESLAAIECIDYVVANQWPSSEKIIEIIKPHVYCKGPDYKDHEDDITGKIKDEQATVELNGGKIIYTDDITFSSSNLLNKYGNLHSQDLESFIRKISIFDIFLSILSKAFHKHVFLHQDQKLQYLFFPPLPGTI